MTLESDALCTVWFKNFGKNCKNALEDLWVPVLFEFLDLGIIWGHGAGWKLALALG